MMMNCLDPPVQTSSLQCEVHLSKGHVHQYAALGFSTVAAYLLRQHALNLRVGHKALPDLSSTASPAHLLIYHMLIL